PADAAGAPAPGASGTEPIPPASDDGEAPPPDAGASPPHLQALMDSIDRTGSRTTRALVEALAPLPEFGLTPEQAAVVGFGRFPVGGQATYSHDWWFPLFGPGWRLHQGTDIFAARGTPVRAPVDGRVRIRNSGLGGLSVYVTGADGTYYYLAHLAGIAPGLADGATVRTGDVVGYVGDSGNARGGMPHVHFEIHPGGGGPIDPKPILDRYLADAIAAAPEVVVAYAEARRVRGPPPGRARAPPRRRGGDGVDAQHPAVGDLGQPQQGAAQLARAEALRAGGEVDWEEAGLRHRAAGRAGVETAGQVDA
ncbi:MAG TPA: M23 family metallopeptidase, partial [Acidimicrobiales bacterium]|nr:M23 family metallopeptidase [Acidimicrobiales bacterium]